MARRHPDAAPGLIDRIRWGNVGRLAALLAAGLLIAAGPRGCRPQDPVAPPRVAAPPPAAPDASESIAESPPERPRRRSRRRAPKRRRESRRLPKATVSPPRRPAAPTLPRAAPPRAYAVPAAPRAPFGGEFSPEG